MEDWKERAKKIIIAKTALAIEGGGALGVGEVGALSRWVELGGDLKKITHVVGSSVGSIIASAIAVGADIEYMKKTLFGLDLQQFEDNSPGLIRDFARLIKKYGWNKGQAITDWAEGIMHELTGNADITMAEAHEMSGVVLTTTGCSLRFMDTFYMNYKTEPKTRLVDSIRMSSSIPLYYAAVFRETKTDCGEITDCIVDGGTMDNYPIHVLREQGVAPHKILGLKLCNTVEMAEYADEKRGIRHDYGEVENLKQCLVKLVEMLRLTAMKLHVHKRDWMLTAKIDVNDMKSTDFDMTSEQLRMLYNNGRKAIDDLIDETAELLEAGEYPLPDDWKWDDL